MIDRAGSFRERREIVERTFPTFTAADTALLLVDHQVGTMKLIRNIPVNVVSRNTLALAKAARILGLPVVLTTS